MEVEDDVFYADLSRRIALLLMDDEEVPVAHCPSASLQAFSYVCHPTAPSTMLYEQTCRRESKGTGVFIPRSSLLRRKNRQGRFTSFNSKSCTRPDRSRGASHIITNDPSCNFWHSKKC